MSEIFILFIAGLFLIIWIVAKIGGTVENKSSSKKISKKQKTILKNQKWLDERWKLAAFKSLPLDILPKWYRDPTTDAQRNLLLEIGFSLKEIPSMKGQASDLIGLFERLADHDRKVLSFFKVPARGFNQSRGRHEVEKLFSDETNVESWKQRPASPIQREFYKHFEIVVPRGLKHDVAAKKISDFERKISDYEDSDPEHTDLKRLQEWESYEELMTDLTDSETCRDYGIKKPSRTLLRKALDDVASELGNFIEACSEIDLIVEKLIEINPDIERID